jgi:TatD DNase family protein
LGFYVGIGGIATFKNSDHDAMLQSVPLKHIVLETDAPYLAPQAERGSRNEPAFVRHVATYLAKVTDSPLDTIATQTTANARAVYGLPNSDTA